MPALASVTLFMTACGSGGTSAGLGTAQNPDTGGITAPATGGAVAGTTGGAVAGTTGGAVTKPGAVKAPTGATANKTTTNTTSTGSGTTTVKPGKTVASDPGISATEIKLGMINMHGMPLGNVLVEPQVRGMQATIAAINDAGGVNGRRLKLVDCDDGAGEVSNSKACMRKLVEQDKIFSMLLSLTWSSASIHTDLAKYKLPMVGGWAYSQTEWQDPWMFPTHMSMLNEAFAGASWVRDVVKPQTFGLICLNSPEMQQACANVNTVLTKAGAKMVKKVDVSLSDTDMSPAVLAFRQANPDHIIHYAINPAPIAKFMIDAYQQGYYPPKGISGNHLAAEVLGQLFGQGPVNRYWTNTTYKLWGTDFAAVINKYAPSNQGLNHHIVQAGYVGTEIFAQAAKKAGPNISRASLMAVLNSQTWQASPSLGQKFMWSNGARDGSLANDAGNKREYMYKYTSTNTSANPDGSPSGFVPDTSKFVIWSDAR